VYPVLSGTTALERPLTLIVIPCSAQYGTRIRSEIDAGLSVSTARWTVSLKGKRLSCRTTTPFSFHCNSDGTKRFM